MLDFFCIYVYCIPCLYLFLYNIYYFFNFILTSLKDYYKINRADLFGLYDRLDYVNILTILPVQKSIGKQIFICYDNVICIT